MQVDSHSYLTGTVQKLIKLLKSYFQFLMNFKILKQEKCYVEVPTNYRTSRGTKIVRYRKNTNVTVKFIDIPCCEMIDEYIFPTPSTPFFTCFSGHVVII